MINPISGHIPTVGVPSACHVIQGVAVLIAGRYDIGTQIGSGGSGSVFRGVDLRLHRDVAVKVIPAANRRTTERQLAEIRTMAAATGHPNVVALYDALLPGGEGGPADDGHADDAHAVLVMELVDGPSLSAVIADGSLPLGVVRRLGSNLAAALAHLHRQGIVHRDIKPANVLIAPDGQAKLADFGISRLGAGSAITSTGFLIGTAGYLSPEQVEGNGAGPESDIYSLGLVLLEAVTGRREFTGPPTEAALARLSRQPAMPAEMPSDLHALLTSMVARERAYRPSAAEVTAALESADLRGAPIAGTGATAVALPTLPVSDDSTAMLDSAATTAWVPTRSRARRRRVATALAAAAIAGVALGAGVLLDRNAPPARVPPASDIAGSTDSSAPESPVPSSGTTNRPVEGASSTSPGSLPGSGAPLTDPVVPLPPAPTLTSDAGTSAAPADPSTAAPGSSRGNSANAPGQTKDNKVKD